MRGHTRIKPKEKHSESFYSSYSLYLSSIGLPQALCELYHSHKRWGDRQLLCLQGFSAVLALVFANAAMPRTSYTGEGTSIPSGTGSSGSVQERGVKEHCQGIQGGDSNLTLGPVPPLPSLFTPAAAVSVLGQVRKRLAYDVHRSKNAEFLNKILQRDIMLQQID